MLGENIRSIRDEKKLGINETARKAGISPSYLSDIEKGNKTNPSTEVLEKIANALEVNIKDFFKNESTTNEKLAEQVKYIESLELNTPEEALKLILSQPVLMAYGGYDLDDLSEEEIMNLANDMLLAMKLSIEKRKENNFYRGDIMDWIKNIVIGLIEVYETRDVYELLDLLEITLIKKKLINDEKGRFLRDLFGNEYIYVSNKLSNEEEKIIIAHELGHLILHTDLSTSYYTDNHLLNKDQIESQANKFASELLISDDVEIPEGMTTKELACYLEVSENLINLKYKDVI